MEWEELLAIRPAAVLALVLACVALPASAADLLAAGDIARTGSGDDLTADLLAGNPNAIVLTLGDNAYDDGTLTEFDSQYDPSWGQHVARTFPSVGNHDYNTTQGGGYDAYFRPKGRPIGALGKHWYSFDYAGWHFVALNSNCSKVGCDQGSEQAAWLEADLANHDADCTLLYWHHPRFSSGAAHGGATAMQDLYEIAHNHGVDVILNGHNHVYERFAPQDAFGNADPTGPTEFVVGTGGASLTSLGATATNSVARAGDLYGVLRITLSARSYAWQFLPAAGFSYSDSGSAYCVGLAPSGWSCGLGPELVLLLPLLARLRRRSAAR